MSDILVIQAPYAMKKEAMKRTYEEFLKQKESGIILLPAGFFVSLYPKDVEVKFMAYNNEIFEDRGEEDGT